MQAAPVLSRHLPVEGSRIPRARIDRLPIRRCSKGQFLLQAVLWASQEGITTGVTADHFQPGATVTRAQVVTFLWRWDMYPQADKSAGFTDVPKHAFYADAVDWAVEVGVTKGTTAKTFSPNDKCIRAQIVTFLYRYFVVD